MPTAANPKPTCALNRSIIMTFIIYIESIDCRTTNRSKTQNLLSIGRPDKMFIPSILSGIEKGYKFLCFGVKSFYEIITATIATMTGKGKIIFIILTSEGLGCKMVECE
jgi:hypothetical protein